MGSVGDVLLPILGGLAGTDPYLGSGLRSALSVSEALARKKWRKEEEQRRADEDERDRLEAERQVREREKLTGDLVSAIEASDLPDLKKRALIVQAHQKPEKAADNFFSYKPPVPGPERLTPEALSTVGEAMRSRFGPDATIQFSGPLEGAGTANITLPRIQQEEEEPYEPNIHQSASMPWLSYWTDEQGRPEFSVNEAMRKVIDSGKGETEDMAEALMAARMEVKEAEAGLEQYLNKKTEEVKTLAGEKTTRQPDIDEDATYRLLQQKVDDAYTRLRRLIKSRGPAAPMEESPAETGGGPQTLYFDSRGNPIQR